MRLHRLRMRAFGPFADETVIDFDDLSRDGLFLLHGLTGAGKTTVLDAAAFALYGRVPGARNDAKRLHSDHAAPDVVPEVELEATIGGRRLVIKRSPEFFRPKKRGGGAPRKINACASLTWVDDPGPALTRIPEIGDAIIAALGMSAEQFFQVALLPQGDFARFLRAKPDERESLLERLFDTERFGGVEAWLRDRTRTSGAELAATTESLERLAGQIVAVSSIEFPVEPDLEWAHTCRADARTAAQTAAARVAATKTAAEQALAALDSGKRIADLRSRGAQARNKLAELDDGADELATVARYLAAARRAAPIVPIIADLGADDAAVASAEHECGCAEAELGALPGGTTVLEDQHAGAVARAIAEWTAESGRLEPLALRAAARDGVVARIATAEHQSAVAATRITDLNKALAQTPARRTEIESDLREATQAVTDLSVLREERRSIDALASATDKRTIIVAELGAADRALNEARARYNSAHERLLELRERRINGMAAELAGRLADGTACVVCGSLQHPNPAVSDASSVSDADEAKASKAERTAAAKRDEAVTARGDTAAKLAAIDALLAGVSPADIEVRLAETTTKLARAQKSAGRLDHLNQALTALDSDTEVWRKELGDKQSESSALVERIAGLRGELAELDAEVHAVTGGAFSVEERRAELTRLCAAAERVRVTRDERTGARKRRAEVMEKLTGYCAAAEFADVDAARAAAASPEQIGAWEVYLTEADRIRSANEVTLADNDVRAALAVDAPDLPALATAHQTASVAYEAATSDHAVRVSRLSSLEQYVEQFGEEFEALEPARARHDELQSLSDLVAGRGQNSRQMSLRSYVLAARLEEVLVAASSRIHQMSSGRYEFVHTDAAGPRGRTGGLGIEVRDEYTGKVRATTTLSGGETFFASLALALGLADVVSAESGGRVLDTIFIDEGFGTLDPESLDLVMGVLDDLRSGGRVVGVVSHVGELQARIPSQLHVMRGENGSTVRVYAALSA